MPLLRNYDNLKEIETTKKKSPKNKMLAPKIYNNPMNNSSLYANVQLAKNRQLSPLTPEIEKLTSQLKQEEQLKEAVEQSYNELLNTAKELEKRVNSIDEEIHNFDRYQVIRFSKEEPPLIFYEGNEWKTRFDNQEEVNRQLSKQIILLEEKFDETKIRSKNYKKSYEEGIKEITGENVSELRRLKESLFCQLRDFSWRLEQENKAYHKVNEERKELNQELIDARNSLSVIKEKNELGGAQLSVRASHSQLQNYTNTSRFAPNSLPGRQIQSNHLPNIHTSRNNQLKPSQHEAGRRSRSINDITRTSNYYNSKVVNDDSKNWEDEREKEVESGETTILPRLKL